ncbi:Acylamino-acid-releasing enzyme [Zea mays]|uniref:Acylamino-acid-releasing enzyme n=1 Tax=Zea mays TaxID=4577 RepID=A0A1D6GQM0_MAIZE|nr:Acylamino-acid-releasing enzyme [Zea mays]
MMIEFHVTELPILSLPSCPIFSDSNMHLLYVLPLYHYIICFSFFIYIQMNNNKSRHIYNTHTLNIV